MEMELDQFAIYCIKTIHLVIKLFTIQVENRIITNPEWLKPEEKPYFHQISMNCLEKLVECIERFNKGEIDADTSSKMEKQILTDKFDAPEFLEFAIENLIE